jgi:hypothetical protein
MVDSSRRCKAMSINIKTSSTAIDATNHEFYSEINSCAHAQEDASNIKQQYS